MLVHISGNAELRLGFAVPGIEVLIFDRPIHELTVLRPHLEIVRYEAQARAEPMRRAAGDAIVGACERPRTLLDQIGLFRVGPITEAPLWADTQYCRPAGVHYVRITQAVRAKNLGRVGALRHLGGCRIESPHICVEVRRNTGTCFEDADVLATLPQFMRNQRAGKA